MFVFYLVVVYLCYVNQLSKAMKLHQKIYIKGIVQRHRLNNGWSKTSINRLLMKMNQDPELFKICASGVRGNKSYHKVLARLENGYNN